MVSLVRLIIAKFYNGILEYWFIPRYHTLRAHSLGLTLGFSIIFIYLGMYIFNLEFLERCCDWIIQADLENLGGRTNIFHVVLILIWFGLVTYYFSIWAMLTIIFLLYLLVFPPEHEFLRLFVLNALYYISGYLFGFVLGIFYNDFLYLYLRFIRKNDCKLIFAYDPKKKLNIIKSPERTEEVQLPDLPNERRLYNFKPVSCTRPYTIAFIANPRYKSTVTNEIKTDPIIRNRDLFLRSVVRALESFHDNEVLGRPEIWSRVRIITIFDADTGGGQANIEGSQQGFVQQSSLASRDYPNIVSPMVNDSALKNIIDGLGGPVKYKDIDVIFSMTAMPDFTRSSALFSSSNSVAETSKGKYHFLPQGKPAPYPKEFEDHANSPGKVALNILGATQKTFVHEFAHAMSHAENGAILDEYYDEGVIALDPSRMSRSDDEQVPAPENPQASESENVGENRSGAAAPAPGPLFEIFAINRQQKDHSSIATPKVFAIYHKDLNKQYLYASDRNHPSAEEDWVSFFPEKKETDVYCTMDRIYGRYQFDKLIADYMYDRLMHKII